MLKEKFETDPKELSIPFYLNQKIVFDLLAIQEDGFSKLSTLKSLSSETENSKLGAGGSIGFSNIFAFLGVSLSAETGKEKGSGDIKEISLEKVHTPTSLFAKFRSNLIKKDFLKQNINNSNFRDLKSGEFVEFRAILKNSPLIDTLSWIKAFAETLAPLYSQPKSTSSSKQRGSSNIIDKNAIKQIDMFLDMVKPPDSVDLIGNLIESQEITAVIPCQPNFFNKGDPSEIIDGEFKVLGKVMKVFSEEKSSINLLRGTALGRLEPGMLKGLNDAFSGLEQYGIQGIDFKISIEAPSFLVTPIAIFL